MTDTPQGKQIWEFEEELFTQPGMNAIAGRRPTQNFEPVRFDQMRPSCYDVDARVRDMDINGIWAAVNFPSMIAGFCGRVFFNAKDPELGQACIRAWNDWLYEEWYSAHPTRIIPLGIAFLRDPKVAVAEIHRNAQRGFTAISMPERPHLIGLPTLWDRSHWDPIIEACVETDTVLSMHVGSSGGIVIPDGAPGLQLGATLFGGLSLGSCAEWLWSGYP
ncbi:MAG TPA: amidohydrolase family protein, partial [Acidimicrobiales bacterium]|nr:amidohydrolase family protein [Acidimicrobiales bacterium]